MTRSIQFIIPGLVNTSVYVEEGDFDGDGFTDLKFVVTVDESNGYTADIRGLFWDDDDNDVANWEVWDNGSPDVTDSQFEANKVDNLGNGSNMKGSITNRGQKFDAGVEIGTQGAGKDDIQSTEFVIRSPNADMSLDDLGGERVGIRLTSVGEIDGPRNDSLKLVTFAPNAPDALDDHLRTDEDTADSINLLTNDTDDDNDPLTVTSIEGGVVGTAFTVTSKGGRDALVTMLADGSFTVDPTGNFEDLTDDQTDTFTLIYGISDGNGGADHAEVTVKIDGVNDAPEAFDDGPFFVESNDALAPQPDVTANDTDVDGMVDPATVAFSGATGSASNLNGLLDYTASDIGGDTTDDSFADTFTYTVDDDAGITSNPANVTVNVIDPLVESDTDSADAANGQLLTLSLSTEDRTFNTDSFYDVSINSGGISQTVNVSFVIDGSGSISSAEYNEQVKAVQNTIDELKSDYAGSPATVNVQLVQFSSVAKAATYVLSDSRLDNVASGTPLDGQLARGTNYEAGLDPATAFFSGKANDDNFLLFTSDGVPFPTNNYQDEVAELNNENVSITAVGFGSANLSTLNQIDNTGGAQIAPNAGALGDVFADSPLTPADLIDFSLLVNGSEVADESDLISLGGGDFELDGTLLGLNNANGAVNNVQAIASFDTTNDGNIDEVRTVGTVIDGTDGSGIVFV